MKVAEKDVAVHGLLQDECDRCREALSALLAQSRRYPKGALNARRKAYKRQRYLYHYLVYREGRRVVNRHVPEAALGELRKQLVQRDRCRREIQAYRRRLAYLEKLLNLPVRRRRQGQ